MKFVTAALASLAVAAEPEWFESATAELNDRRELQNGVTFWAGNYTDSSNPFAVVNPSTGLHIPIPINQEIVECKVEAGGQVLAHAGMLKKSCCGALKARTFGLVLSPTPPTGVNSAIQSLVFSAMTECYAADYVPASFAAFDATLSACQNATIPQGFTEHLPTGYALLLGGSVNVADDCECWNSQLAGLQGQTGTMLNGALVFGYIGADGTGTCEGSESSAGYNLPIVKVDGNGNPWTTTTTTTSTTTTTTTAGSTTTTTTTVPAKVTGAVSLTSSVPSACSTSADFTGTLTTLCAAVKAAMDEGTCEALKTAAGNSSAIVCAGVGANFASVLTLSRRLEESEAARELQVSKTVAMDYTITIDASSGADATVATLATAIATTGTTALATSIKDNVTSKVAADASLTSAGMAVTAVTATTPVAVASVTGGDAPSSAVKFASAALVFVSAFFM